MRSPRCTAEGALPSALSQDANFKKVLSFSAQLMGTPFVSVPFSLSPSSSTLDLGRGGRGREFLWCRIPLALMGREVPLSHPTPSLPVNRSSPHPAYPKSHRFTSSLLLLWAPEHRGGSVGGICCGPAPALLAPPPTGSRGCSQKVISVCVHVTVLGWNVNNKQECPSIPRVPEGRVLGCTRPLLKTCTSLLGPNQKLEVRGRKG